MPGRGEKHMLMGVLKRSLAGNKKRINPASPLQFDHLHLDVIGSDEHKYMLGAYRGKSLSSDTIVGMIEYTVLDDMVHIDMVQTHKDMRRTGIGKAMVKNLFNEYPDAEFRWGFMTEEGEALRKSIEHSKGKNPMAHRRRNPTAAKMLLSRMVEPGDTFTRGMMISAMKASGRKGAKMWIDDLLDDALKHGIVERTDGGYQMLKGAAVNPKEKMLMVTLAYIGDDYLAAADYGKKDESYFRDLQGEDGFEVVHVGLPKEIAEKIVLQGTSDQWYSDGYEAANEVALYIK